MFMSRLAIGKQGNHYIFVIWSQHFVWIESVFWEKYSEALKIGSDMKSQDGSPEIKLVMSANNSALLH